MPSVLLDRIRVRAFDDKTAEIMVGPGPNLFGVSILSFRTPPGLKGYITNFGQAWDAALNLNVKYYLRVNGGVINSFNGLIVQTSPPETAGLYPIPNPIPLEQLSLIDVLVDVTAAVSGNFAARVVCKYYDLKDVGTI